MKAAQAAKVKNKKKGDLFMAKFLETEQEFRELLKSEKPVLVDFFATWCGPCKMLMPVVDKYAEEQEGFEVIKVDIDKFKDLAVEYSVKSVPTLKIIKDSEEMDSSSGYKPYEQLKSFLEKHL
jgi:thioredoxin 1